MNGKRSGGRVITLVTGSQPNDIYGFVPGEPLTGLTSGAIGYVRDWNPSIGRLNVVVDSGTFAAAETVQGNTFNNSIIVASIIVPTYVVDVTSVTYSVTGANAKVALEWANSSASVTMTTLSGSGYIGRNNNNNLSMRFTLAQVPALTNPNGNIYISTYGIPAKGGYSVLLELRKAAGFAQRPVY
jgi:hypothetical protein